MKKINKIEDFDIVKLHKTIMDIEEVLQCEWFPYRDSNTKELLYFSIIVRFKKCPEKRYGRSISKREFPNEYFIISYVTINDIKDTINNLKNGKM